MSACNIEFCTRLLVKQKAPGWEEVFTDGESNKGLAQRRSHRARGQHPARAGVGGGAQTRSHRGDGRRLLAQHTRPHHVASITLLGTHADELKPTSIKPAHSITALSVIIKNWKQPRWSSTRGWMHHGAPPSGTGRWLAQQGLCVLKGTQPHLWIHS